MLASILLALAMLLPHLDKTHRFMLQNPLAIQHHACTHMLIFDSTGLLRLLCFFYQRSVQTYLPFHKRTRQSV